MVANCGGFREVAQVRKTAQKSPIPAISGRARRQAKSPARACCPLDGQRRRACQPKLHGKGLVRLRPEGAEERLRVLRRLVGLPAEAPRGAQGWWAVVGSNH